VAHPTAHSYELQVNKIEEIKELLVEVLQSSNMAIERRVATYFSVFCQVLQKH